MSHRDLRYLNNNRIIYRRYSSDIPTSSHSWGWYYEEGTYGYYALFNNKAKPIIIGDNISPRDLDNFDVET